MELDAEMAKRKFEIEQKNKENESLKKIEEEKLKGQEEVKELLNDGVEMSEKDQLRVAKQNAKEKMRLEKEKLALERAALEEEQRQVNEKLKLREAAILEKVKEEKALKAKIDAEKNIAVQKELERKKQLEELESLKKQQDAQPDTSAKKVPNTPENKGPSSIELLEQQLQAERELELAKELEKIKKEKEKLASGVTINTEIEWED